MENDSDNHKQGDIKLWLEGFNMCPECVRIINNFYSVCTALTCL